MTTVSVLGAGAWGTALAVAAARSGCKVILQGRDARAIEDMTHARENARHLPGVVLDPAITPVFGSDAVATADLVLAAVPAQALRSALTDAGAAIGATVPIVACAKGIERESGLFMSEVVRSVLPGNPVAALSGPSFAADVGRGLPTAVTVAAETLAQAAAIADRLTTPALRLYHSDDLVGVEIGGAVKNVLAIACGIAQGRGLGASAVAALTARAFAELMRFGRACGARPETLMGLSGFGDLVLTCGTSQSRNFAHGVALGRGSLPSTGSRALVEGVATAPILLAKARTLGVNMPIVEAVDGILSGRIGVGDAVDALLARPVGPEAASGIRDAREA